MDLINLKEQPDVQYTLRQEPVYTIKEPSVQQTLYTVRDEDNVYTFSEASTEQLSKNLHRQQGGGDEGVIQHCVGGDVNPQTEEEKKHQERLAATVKQVKKIKFVLK